MPKNNSKTFPIALTSIKISLLSFLAEAVFQSIAALVMLKSDFVSSKVYIIAAYLVFTVSTGICAILTARMVKEKVALNCFASEFCLLVLNYLSILIISGFKLEIKSLILIPISVVVTIICVILNNGKKKRR